MNVFIVTKQPFNMGREDFCISLIPNLFYRGLDYYMRLLRISRYGADGWGKPWEIDQMEAEDRRELYG